MYTIKKLIYAYYFMEDGVFVLYPYNLLKVSNNPKVLISRRSLKHFVERRKSELRGRSVEDIFYKLNFAIEHVEKTIQKYDSIVIEDYKIIYSKSFDELRASLRIITELVNKNIEIKSIHFQKYNKKIT